MHRLAAVLFAPALVLATANANAFTFTADLGGGDGTVIDFSNPEGAFDLSFIMVGSDSGGEDEETSVVTSYTATATANRTIVGEFAYLSNDIDGPDLDPFGYIVNGDLFPLTDDEGGASQIGTFSFDVLIGDVFGWYIDATDNTLGAASVSVGASIVPVPAALPLLGTALLGLGFARRRA